MGTVSLTPSAVPFMRAYGMERMRVVDIQPYEPMGVCRGTGVREHRGAPGERARREYGNTAPYVIPAPNALNSFF